MKLPVVSKIFQIESVLSIALFATYPTFAKIVLAHNEPWIVTAVVELLTALMIILFYGMLPEMKKLFRAYRKHELVPLLLMGVFAGVLGPLLVLMGFKYSSVINGVLILAIQTPITILLSSMFLGEKVTKEHILGFLVFSIGLLAYTTQFFTHGIEMNLYDLYFVAGAFVYAISNIIYKKYVSHISHELVILMRNLFGGLAITLFIIIGVFEGGLTISTDIESIMGMLLIVAIPVILAQSLWYYSLEKIKMTSACIFDALYPIFAGLIAFLFGHGELLFTDIMTGNIMIFGIIISQLEYSGLLKSRGAIYVKTIFNRERSTVHLQTFKQH